MMRNSLKNREYIENGHYSLLKIQAFALILVLFSNKILSFRVSSRLGIPLNYWFVTHSTPLDRDQLKLITLRENKT